MAHHGEQVFEAYGEKGLEAYGAQQPFAATTGQVDEDPLMEQFNLMQNWMQGEDPQTFATCFLSPAESALRNASGTDRPIECWGCTGHATHHATRFHSFRDCPNKYDPEVRTAAFRRMKQQREEWEGRKRDQQPSGRKREATAMLAKTEAVQDWEELGFASQRDAERAAEAAALMTTALSARNRQRLAREWARKWERSETEGTQHQGWVRTATYYGHGTGNTGNGTGGHQTYNFIARVFQATPIRTIPLEISPTLPHCQFPIGPTHGTGKLTVALDSCAGVNIGHLDFHKVMAETFPEFVAT